HPARSLQRSRRAGQWLRDRDRLPEIREETESPRLAVAVLRNAGPCRHRPGTRRAQRRNPRRARLHPGPNSGFPGTKDHLAPASALTRIEPEYSVASKEASPVRAVILPPP